MSCKSHIIQYCHSHIVMMECSRRFWNNDVMTMYLIHVDLKAYIWSFTKVVEHGP